MKFLVSVLITILLSFGACLYLPWWSIALVAFIVSVLIPQKAWISFISGFVSLFLLWYFLSFWISANNENILAHRISLLFLKSDSPYYLILLTAFIGAIVAGFSALSGSLFRFTFLNKKLKD